jgi:energy-converting hydrogenase B subunit D
MDATRNQRAPARRFALPPRPGGGACHRARSSEPEIIPLQTRDPLRQTLVAGLYGLALAVLMVVLQAPDVALSEIVVSSVASPFILLTALAKLQRRRTRK